MLLVIYVGHPFLYKRKQYQLLVSTLAILFVYKTKPSLFMKQSNTSYLYLRWQFQTYNMKRNVSCLMSYIIPDLRKSGCPEHDSLKAFVCSSNKQAYESCEVTLQKDVTRKCLCKFSGHLNSNELTSTIKDRTNITYKKFNMNV